MAVVLFLNTFVKSHTNFLAYGRSQGVRWSPFPTQCAQNTLYYPSRDAEHKAPGWGTSKAKQPGTKVAIIGIEKMDIDDITINFEMYRGVFNIAGDSYHL